MIPATILENTKYKFFIRQQIKHRFRFQSRGKGNKNLQAAQKKLNRPQLSVRRTAILPDVQAGEDQGRL